MRILSVFFSVAIAFSFSTFAHAKAGSSTKPARFVPATIVKAVTNAMFPVATYQLTFMKPCSSGNVRKIQYIQNNVNYLGVEMELPQNNAGFACLAMPRPVTVEFVINNMSPASVEILAAKDGLEIEIGELETETEK